MFCSLIEILLLLMGIGIGILALVHGRIPVSRRRVLTTIPALIVAVTLVLPPATWFLGLGLRQLSIIIHTGKQDKESEGALGGLVLLFALGLTPLCTVMAPL